MRGAFVACFGESAGASLLDSAVAALRWHAGEPSRWDGGRLHVGMLVDPDDGPFIDLSGAAALVVHGSEARPLADLERRGRRFAAIEYHDGRLAAARDPLGLCPLFYRPLDGCLWLSNELAPLVGLAPVRADLPALAAQAALVPHVERTGFEGIFRVLPGHRLEATADLDCGQRAYWQPRRLLGTYRGTRAEAVEELGRRLAAAVDRTADSSTGVLLSGGLDSTAVAAFAARRGRPVTLVHVRFPGFRDAQEQVHAHAVADAAGLPLNVVTAPPAVWNPEAELELTTVPYLTQSIYTGEAGLARLTELGVRTALDGNDGDGVFGYTGREWGELLRTASFGRLRELAGRYGRRTVVHSLLDDIVPPSLRLRRLRRRPPARPTYLQMIERYFDEPLRDRMRAIDHERWQSPVHEWRSRQLRQVSPVTTVAMEEHELRGATFDIDLRHPFADRELVEFLVSLPVAVKSDPFRSKDLLREALASLAPAAVVERPDKPEYTTVFAGALDPARCLGWIRESGVRLPGVDYDRLLREGTLGAVPWVLLMSLARVHVFAAPHS